MQKKTLQELNLMDDFLFYKLVSHPVFGEQFGKELLQIILGKTVGKLTVVPQKVYYGADTMYHGARLDVYLEEEAGEEDSGAIYDVEAEQTVKKETLENMPKRSRYYHSTIDAGALLAGADYRALKNVIVIMIMSKDPFDRDHVIYTIENHCKEIPDMPYDDGAKTIFLYTKGRKGNVSEELRGFLKYMEQSLEENATSETIQRIHRMVTEIKRDKEASIEYMKAYERERMIREEGIERGREENLRECIEKMAQNGLSADEIVKILEVDRDIVLECFENNLDK